MSRSKLKWIVVLSFVVSAKGNLLFAQDTIKQQTMENFTVYGTYEPFNVSTKQILNIENEKLQSAYQLSEAIKFFSGVNLKDYGGIGGLKTITVRGLGANHTAVSFDGVALSDCQTGQIDVGKLSLENMETLAMINANAEADIFKPARLFASANTLQVMTKTPSFKEGKPVNINVGIKMGSFLTFNPYLLMENKIGKHFSTSISAEYLYTKGNYPYKLYYGGANDSISNERRKNADVSAFSAVANVFYTDSSNSWHLKGYLYNAKKGLPGATILYSEPSKQRLDDDNYFLQSVYAHQFKKVVSYKNILKFNYAHTHYIDPKYHNSEGKIDNHYYQREIYMSNILLLNVIKDLNISLSNDISYANMSANLYQFAYPHRWKILSNVAITYQYQFLRLQANLLHTYALDKTKIDNRTDCFNHFSPAANMEFRLLKKEKLTFSTTYQHVFRLPTFNDMYYQLAGNRDLKPETIHQVMCNLAWMKNFSKSVPYFKINLDGYFHLVNNKIVAFPNRNLFIWSMLNYGKVHVWGLDAVAYLQIEAASWMDIDINLSYSYQYAVDMTDENSKTYKNQIAYTPRHSGNCRLLLNTKWVDVAYVLVMVGKRYRLGQNVAAFVMEPYFDHSIAVSRDFEIKAFTLQTSVELLNIANKNYEIIDNFPVAGISWRLKLGFKW